MSATEGAERRLHDNAYHAWPLSAELAGKQSVLARLRARGMSCAGCVGRSGRLPDGSSDWHPRLAKLGDCLGGQQ